MSSILPCRGEIKCPNVLLTPEQATEFWFNEHSQQTLCVFSENGKYRACVQTRKELVFDLNRDGWIHIVSMADRPGFAAFSARVEQDMFQPDTPANDQYIYRHLIWPQELDMLWQIVSLPSDYKEKLTPFLEEFQLRLTDAMPVMFSAKGTQEGPVLVSHYFPVWSPSSYLIQYEEGHPMMGANLREQGVIRTIIGAEAERIMKEGS